MSELVVIGFDDKYKADEMLLDLLRLEQDHLADLEDAVVVTKNAEGKIRVKPYHDLVKPGDLSNELWGGILSAIVFHRALELIDDPSAAAIDANFMQETLQLLQPNTSALFVLVRHADSEKTLVDLQRLDGKLLKTTLTDEQLVRVEA